MLLACLRAFIAQPYSCIALHLIFYSNQQVNESAHGHYVLHTLVMLHTRCCYTNHQPNKWRLIVDLSYPKGHIVNDGIPKSLCSLSYISVDDAINQIIAIGPNTLLTKLDIKNAFQLLPVHPTDRHLLAMEWENAIYLDTCLPSDYDLHQSYWIS